MKFFAMIFLACSATGAMAAGGIVNFPSSERNEAVSNAVAALPSVSPYLAMAKSMYAAGGQAEPLFIYSPETGSGVDCDDRPSEYSGPALDFCAFTAQVAYGWYADPTLVVKVKGYLSRSKIAAGVLSAADFKIVEVSIGSPLPTGLE